VDGALMIIAGPGSGKTRTLTHRIAHLVAGGGVAAENCLAITFTRRAAGELRERLGALLGGAADAIAIHTFHSLGLAILREHPAAAGLHRGFHIADEAERTAILAAALAVSPHKAETLLRAISTAKRTGVAEGEIAAALAAYARAMQVRDAVDFDDLIGLPLAALVADPALAAHYRDRFRHVCVDEFQDVDAQQLRLLALIARPGANICVIGDPDQAIYGFRGADASCFERFRADHPDAKSVRLDRNYRSTGTIVTASAQVIGAAGGEAPIAGIVREMHERITLHAAPTERAEAEFVVATIERMIGGHSFFSLDSGRASGAGATLSFADFAVLYRTDAQSDALVEAFARSGMPFKKHGAGRLGDDPVVRALMAESAAGDEPLAVRLVAAADRLERRDDAPAAAPLRLALQRMTLLAERSGNDPARFADALALASEADFFDARADRVALLTLHAAKGLEFPVVFIAGIEEGLLPLAFGTPAAATLAEERRLLYVGMTRARDRLILSRAERRMWRGRTREQAPSRLLADIERALVEQQASALPRRPQAAQQLSLF
jgi:DNA helicase-2/ATP-dependent DNA helicase PcrA